MKKILFILLMLSFGFTATKAQTPKIHIQYDDNGNRVLRYWTPNKPAPSQETQPTDSVLITGNNKDAASGLMNATENNLKVYPNPSNDNFNVVVSEGILNADAELVLIDQLGREHKKVKIKSTTTTISTKGMADGVYSIIVQYGNMKSTTKVVRVTN